MQIRIRKPKRLPRTIFTVVAICMFVLSLIGYIYLSAPNSSPEIEIEDIENIEVPTIRGVFEYLRTKEVGFYRKYSEYYRINMQEDNGNTRVIIVTENTSGIINSVSALCLTYNSSENPVNDLREQVYQGKTTSDILSVSTSCEVSFI